MADCQLDVCEITEGGGGVYHQEISKNNYTKVFSSLQIFLELP